MFFDIKTPHYICVESNAKYLEQQQKTQTLWFNILLDVYPE